MTKETKPKVEMRGCTPLSDEEFFKLYYSTERKSEMSLNKSKPGEFFYDRAKEYLKAWGNFTDEKVETYQWSLVDVITIMQEFNICDVQVSLDAGKDEAAEAHKKLIGDIAGPIQARTAYVGFLNGWDAKPTRPLTELTARELMGHHEVQKLIDEVDRIMTNPVYTSQLALTAWHKAKAPFRGEL